jgi:hypothetical protein
MLASAWIFVYDVVLELLFAIVTLVVSLLAFKVYRVTSQKQVFYLAWGFLFVSLSNIFRSIINFLIITEINQDVSVMVKVQSIVTFNNMGIFLHLFFMILGLSLFAFMTFRTKDIRLLILITGLSLMAVFFSVNPLHNFHYVSSLLLIIISYYFIKNYLRNKKTMTLLVAIAFLFLLFGNIHFLFSVNHEVFYVIGHMLELVAYGLVLTNFFMVLKR